MKLATWPTRAEIMEARKAAGFTSPIAPLEPGESWLVFDTRGTYELMVHPGDVAHYLEHGFLIDGRPLPVSVLEEWPLLNAVQIRASDALVNVEWIEAAAA